MNREIKLGEELTAIETGPISRHMIAHYAAGSGDLNPIHVDIDFAREKAGLNDVIVHGMFSMGYLGRVVVDWAGSTAIRSLEARFHNIVQVMDAIRCEGTISAVEMTEDGTLVTVELSARKSDKTVVASGVAKLLLPA